MVDYSSATFLGNLDSPPNPEFGKVVMEWSAAPTARGPTPGNRVRLVPGSTARRPMGERRAAPPGTRLREDFCHFVLAKRRKVAKQQRRHPMNIHTIGIDLGKTSFHLVGLSEQGAVIVRKHFSRAQLLRFTANRTG